jgi:hypothetical protein
LKLRQFFSGEKAASAPREPKDYCFLGAPTIEAMAGIYPLAQE